MRNVGSDSVIQVNYTITTGVSARKYCFIIAKSMIFFG